MASPTLPAGVQPPAFKTPFFNKEHQIDAEWKRCFLSWQTAITALLQFTQHIGGSQGFLGFDDPDQGEPAFFATPVVVPPTLPTSAFPSILPSILETDGGETDLWFPPGSTIPPISAPSSPARFSLLPESDSLEADLSWPPGFATVFRSLITSTATGTQNNWAPGLGGDTTIEWSGASNLTLTGLAGGFTGQIVTFLNTGSNVAFFQHANAGSTATNRFTNLVTTGDTPVAAGGAIQYVYDGTNWKLIRHEQGAGVTRTFAAGNYTASGSMTWTVAAGNVTTEKYWVRGKILHVEINISSTTVGGTLSNILTISIPGGYTSTQIARSTYAAVDLGASPVSQNSVVDANGTGLNCFWDILADNWSATADARVQMTKDFEVT